MEKTTRILVTIQSEVDLSLEKHRVSKEELEERLHSEIEKYISQQVRGEPALEKMNRQVLDKLKYSYAVLPPDKEIDQLAELGSITIEIASGHHLFDMIHRLKKEIARLKNKVERREK